MSKIVLQLAPGHCAPATLITPRSHLVDQHVADCEIIALPARDSGGGTLSFELKEGQFSPPAPGRRRQIQRKLQQVLQPPPPGPTKDTLIDMRAHSPENWAHFITNHLPIVFVLCDQADIDWHDVTLILPRRTPARILEAAAMFGFHTLCSNEVIDGRGLFFEATPLWTGIRGARVGWARNARATAALKQAGVYQKTTDPGLPERVFISRRGTRQLENQTEVQDYLAKRGFETLYTEQLSVRDQFRLFQGARQIVAIHGAGLAPLMYRTQNAGPCDLIELFPCSIMNNHFRMISGLVGCGWIGIRGKIKPDYIKDLYDLEAPFLTAANDSFEIDLASLDYAFEKLQAETPD